MMPPNVALIVAAGRGFRLGGPVPKQYLELAGETVLRRTLAAFLSHPDIAAVQVIIHPNDAELYAAATAGLAVRPPAFGGATRQESVRKGLAAIADLSPANVLIHDAVRPFVSAATISAVLAALAEKRGAIAAVPLTDTLKRGAGGVIAGTIDRANLFRAQTPQGFHYAAICDAHDAVAGAETEFTDDAMIAEHAGLAVAIVAGSENNFKITTTHDLQRAAFMLTNKGESHEL